MTSSNTMYSMLLLLSLFSFFRCSSAPKAENKVESETDRQTAYASNPDALYPVKKKDKWGYINRKGEIVLPLQWDEADDFFEGYAKAGKITGSDLAYGFIDRKGNWIVEPQYDRVGNFSDGYAMVSKDDKYGYINTEGKEIIPLQFAGAGHFHNGYAAIEQGGWTGFINKTGTIVIKPAYTISVSHPRFNEGRAPVFGADEQTGFLDTTGQWAISAQFHSAGNFVNGLAWAMWKQDDSSAQYGFTIKGGYIDTEGVYVIPPEYDFGWDFSEGYATVWVISEDRKSKIWKVIDEQGNVVLDNLPYRNVGAMGQGLIPIQDEKMNWGFMNIKGEVIIPPRFSGINHFKNGIARMEVGTAFSNTIEYINPRGETVWSEK